MAAVMPQDLAQAMQYGPQTQQAIRRSTYLADALRQLTTDGSQNIRSPWELGTKLLAAAILNKATDRAQAGTLAALKADQDAETAKYLAPLQAAVQPPAAQASPIQLPQAPAPASAPQAQDAPAQPPQPPQAAPTTAYSAQDRDALTRMIALEAGGEGPQGMAAAGHVALNRLKNGYGGAKSLSDVIYQPHQFEGITSGRTIDPQTLAAAQPVADAILSGQAPDPTNGAMAFLNPKLQTDLGRPIPKWAQGDGQRIGNHVFFGGQPQPGNGPLAPAEAQVLASAQAEAHRLPPGALSGGGNPQGGNSAPQLPGGGSLTYAPSQPYQVASNGQTPPPPSAPGSSPSAAGTGAAAPSPQAPAAAPTSSPQWPTWRPSEQELGYVRNLLGDPRTHAMGVQEALKMQEKMTQPVEATVQMINGVPFYVAKDPTSGAPIAAIPVPKEALTQTMSAQSAGLAGAPQGLNVQRDPLGNLKDAPGAPPPGYEVGPGGQLRYRQGGPDDPTRPQAPPQGYRYTDGGQQEFIPGSSADPTKGQNLAQGVLSIKKDIDPIVTSAMKVRQNYGAVTTGFRQQNGTGDIAMINGLQKLIDEGVVKGEDVTMQMKSNGLDGTLGGYAQFLSSGGLLSPDIRQKVFHTATDLYQNLDQTYKSRVLSMKPGVDKLYGDGAFDSFVFPQPMVEQMGWGAPAAAPRPPQAVAQPHLTPGTKDAAMAEARRRGLIP